MNIFDIIPENFFSILSSKNKKLYAACLIEAFKIYETGSILGTDKKLLADELTNYLENSNLSFDKDEDLDDDDATEALSSKKSLAYFALRKIEEAGWIYVDVNADYEEIVNFTDAGITICEALLKISPQITYSSDDDYVDDVPYLNPNEYNGYIYTIYSLLTNPINRDYPLILEQVYSNTRQLLRAIRRLDSRMKDYIQTVVDTSEIKDLIDRLIDYKNELIDNGYVKLKTGDNINKYRLPIVTKLEEYEQNQAIMYTLIEDYKQKYRTLDDPSQRVYHDLDDMIDVFNSLDSFISEIDYKNKRYIDSTIGKIKFLLTEDDNISGKLNTILKYIKIEGKANHMDSAINSLQQMFTLRQTKTYNQESSLYTPRGRYTRIDNQLLDLSTFDFDESTQEYLKAYGLPYEEKEIRAFFNKYQINGELVASNVCHSNTDLDTVMMLIYTLIYACEQSWDVTKLDDEVKHYKFTFTNFVIKAGE